VCPVGRDRVASGRARAGGVGEKTREKTTTDLGDSAPESRARASVSSADAGRASLDAPARFPSPSRTAPAASARRSSPPTPGERHRADSVWSPTRTSGQFLVKELSRSQVDPNALPPTERHARSHRWFFRSADRRATLKRSHHRENDRGGPVRIGNLPKRRAGEIWWNDGIRAPRARFRRS